MHEGKGSSIGTIAIALVLAGSGCDDACEEAQRRVADRLDECDVTVPGGPAAPTACGGADPAPQRCFAACYEATDCEVFRGEAGVDATLAFSDCLDACTPGLPDGGVGLDGPTSCVTPAPSLVAFEFVPDGVGLICTPAEVSALSVHATGSFTYPLEARFEANDCANCPLAGEPPVVASVAIPAGTPEVRVPDFVSCPDVGPDAYLVSFRVSLYDACGTLIDAADKVFSCCRPGSPMCGRTCG